MSDGRTRAERLRDPDVWVRIDARREDPDHLAKIDAGGREPHDEHDVLVGGVGAGGHRVSEGVADLVFRDAVLER